MSEQRIYNVLFLCTGNSARSIFGEVLTNHWGLGRFRGYSAGSHVCGHAAAEACPVWPGQPMSAHWGIPDPAAAEGNNTQRMLAFREAFRALENRIKIFVNLPLRSLDKVRLQQKPDEIGQAAAQSVENG